MVILAKGSPSGRSTRSPQSKKATVMLGSVPNRYDVILCSWHSLRSVRVHRGLFWLNDKQWARIEAHLPTGLPGPERDDDRRIISGIIHMLQSGGRWRDCPGDYGPSTTIYNRFNRWAKKAAGVRSSRPWQGRARTPSPCRWTPPRSRLIAAPRAEKGGAKSGHRPLARRAHDQNPWPERSALPAGHPSSDPRPGRRHCRRARYSGPRATHARAPRRQSL